ncbi:recombination regulator RecX [Pseudomonas daroniae]|uniref:Regulatory protein RecX n=1 Tax=Phytopseudomonas daroniae TaxID=2487519 RepID=A0A4Q9QGB0_9GAMM|nr:MULTISPECIES: recombination regulator RecX [Pseudomonas]TBU72725.1 recombination regulator RecX [Pseudomonas daroniae]TBU77526.1 recombination regulator RecX [Pseudomonas sp. FRB 228]TBU87610.1 recombination regulator RecX [Pseudomonas daroniae]
MAVILDNQQAVRHTAMDLLARREHGRVELSRKLRQRGASDEHIEAALDRLSEEGLLSEARYLESFISYRARSGFGPQRIRDDLSQRGLARADIEQALRDSGIDWREGLQETWQRKFAGQLPSDARERARQMRFLVYRGYPMDLVGQLMRGALADD